MVAKSIHNLILGMAIPLQGILLALPVAAQTTSLTSNQAPLPMRSLVLASKTTPAKPNPPYQIVWPQTPEVIEQPIQLVLKLGERQLYVYRGETLEKSFPVAVGQPGWETPTGTFEVTYMLENPGWTNPFTGAVMPPGPENPLGERWIAFWTDGQNEVGFHGTPNRASVGQAASHGCVRLYNEHIRELYDLVNPGTSVTVIP